MNGIEFNTFHELDKIGLCITNEWETYPIDKGIFHYK